MFVVDVAGDGFAAGFGEFFEGDGFVAGEGNFYDFAAGNVDFEVAGLGVGEADTGLVSFFCAILRFKANLLFALFFLDVAEFC